MEKRNRQDAKTPGTEDGRRFTWKVSHPWGEQFCLREFLINPLLLASWRFNPVAVFRLNGKWQMANGKWQMAKSKEQRAKSKEQRAKSKEQMANGRGR